MKFITQAAKVLNEQKKYKRRLAVFLCLAVVVALGTAAALKMYGQAMSHKQKKLVCRYAAHAHTDGCFDGEAVVCGYADYAVHLHNDDCYGPNGELVCHLPEAEAHVHTEECYTEQEVLICEEEGAQAHEHTEGCYTPERGELSCQMEEHMHEDSCYGENGEIICPLEEHQHDDNCYQWKEVLTCTLGAHEHTQDCYTREMRELSCNLEEHEHGEACYDENGELVCQLEEHTHDDDCYMWEDVLTCQLEESDGGHVHGDGCYEMQKVLTCGKLELHTHDDSCYDENGALTCGLLQLEEHVHGEDCFETVELTEEEIIALSGAGGESVSGDAVSGDSVSGDSVSADDAKEAHEHTNECYDAAGGLICGYETAEEPSITKTFEDEKYIITAAYDKDANIPEDAELYAEMITAESNGEHYAQREAELKETLQDENVKMDALFKIGFYVDDEEIEPESDVMITVQFLDENGMADGIPMTIVHFADGGSEILGGSHAKDGSTTFKTRRFSEFGIVSDYETLETAEQADEVEEYSSVSGRINLSESFRYESENYDITFHIKGKVEVPVDSVVSTDKTEAESSSSNNVAEAPSASPEENNGDSGFEDESTGSPGEDSGFDEEIGAGEPEDGEEASTDESGSDESDSKDETADKGGTEETLTENERPSSNQSPENAGEQKAEFKVELLNKDAEEYAAVNEYSEKNDKGGIELLLDVLSYSVTYGGRELDVSDCEITAEVSPSKALLEQAEQIQIKEAENEGVQGQADGDSNTSVVFTLMKVSSGAQVEKIDEMDIDESTIGEVKTYTMPSEEAQFFAARASGQPNPKFTVQYYANLKILNKTGTNALPVIDTSGRKLPQNKKGTGNSPNGNAIKNIYVDGNGKIQTTITPTEVYKSRPFEYHKAPSFNYVNALIKNPNYTLKEVWVLETGKNATSINRGDWKIYPYSKDLHFTNRTVSAEGNNKYILISEGATLRLVYDTTDAKPDFKAAFYDYDISSGHMYTNVTNAISNKNTGITQTGSQQDGTLYYAYTKEAGINSSGNYSGSGTKLSFGNVNTGTSMGENLWDGNLLNKYNGTQSPHPTVAGSYKGCTFGLVTGLANGKIQYAANVNAPKLFNEGSATGKTSYDKDQYSLKFNRLGDTYTLTAVNGTGTTGLESFGHPSPNSTTTHTHIWTNDFWPMDSAASYGTNGHDLKFGSYADRGNRAYAGSSTTGEPGSTSNSKKTFPYADDGKDHNSYFGMKYEVEFELSKDYVGPLEYYFFGDDDMWVFLDNTLVCDIGGVHSSVGEYVNLWDYLAKGSEGKHTLSFFYTERGASGSTCWMQFTLPSVSSLTPETTDEDYGHLKIEKTVTQMNNGTGTAVDNNDEFTFRVHFTKDGKNLPDDYSYVKFDKNGTEIGSDLIIWDGGEFTLKNGEYIIVQYLPQGTKYEVTEINGAITITDNTSETSKVEYFTDITGGGNNKTNLEDGKTATGDIPKSDTTEVEYNNKFYVYELPETGGPGTTIIYMAVLLLAGTAALLKYKQLRYRREGVNR